MIKKKFFPFSAINKIGWELLEIPKSSKGVRYIGPDDELPEGCVEMEGIEHQPEDPEEIWKFEGYNFDHDNYDYVYRTVMKDDRWILIIDVYTFATQVIAKSLGNKNWNNGPSITVLKTGRIISANMYAKQLKINNSIKLSEAKEIALEHNVNLNVFEIPEYPSGKPDQSLLRAAAQNILKCIREATSSWKYPPTIEWVPLDEIYLDITDQVNASASNVLNIFKLVNYFMKYPNSGKKLRNIIVDAYDILDIVEVKYKYNNPPQKFPLCRIIGSKKTLLSRTVGEEFPVRKKYVWDRLIAEIRTDKLLETIYKETGFYCSGGIGCNKMLAKIANFVQKPGTVLTIDSVEFEKYSPNITLKKLSRIPPEVRHNYKEKNWNSADIIAKEEPWKKKDIKEDIGEGKTREELKQGLIVKLVTESGYDDRDVVTKLYTNHVNCKRNFEYRPIFSEKNFTNQLIYLASEFLQRLNEEKENHNRVGSKYFFVLNYKLRHNFSEVVTYTSTVPLDCNTLSNINTQKIIDLIVKRTNRFYQFGITKLCFTAKQMKFDVKK